MEKGAPRNALNRLSAVVKVDEVATDASASIKKMMGKYMCTGYFGGIPLSSKHFQRTIQLGAIFATACYALTFIAVLFMHFCIKKGDLSHKGCDLFISFLFVLHTVPF